MKKQYVYWPSIEYRCGIIQDKMSTSEPFHSTKSAREQFALWAEDFRIMHAWIDVHDPDNHLARVRRITLF